MIEMAAQKGSVVAAFIALGGLVGVLLRSILPYRKSLIDSLRDRVERLEKMLESERALNRAEVALLRHRVANAEHALDLLLELVEADPGKAAAHAKKIRQKREQDRILASNESATIRAAEIAAAKSNPPTDPPA